MFMPDSLCEDCTRPESNKIAGVEDYKQSVELVFGHVNVPEDAHDARLPQSRLVEMDEERDPPCLRQEAPEILAQELCVFLRSYCSYGVFVVVVKQGCVVDICSDKVVGASMVRFAASIRLGYARNSFFVSDGGT